MPKSIIDVGLTDDQTVEIEVADGITELKLPGADVDFTSTTQALRLDQIQNCPRCAKPLVPALAISGVKSVSFLECPECGTLINTYIPTVYQSQFLRRSERYKMTSGGFGCHAPDELILLHNGRPKKARDVVIGDQLMGPDGTPRTVLTLHHGYDTQYQVTPRGVSSPMLFNGKHLMYLYNREYTGINKRGHHNYLGQYAVMTIEEYEKQSKRFKQSHYWLFAEGFEYPEQPVTVDPYLLGLLLGDGYLGKTPVTLTTCDEVIIEHVKRYNKMYELRMNISKESGTSAVSISFTSANRKRKGVVTNILTQYLKDLDLIGKLSQTKHIPDIYKYNSKDVRMKLLAGLIDSDGYQHCNTIDIILAGEQLAKDIKEVALSLGIRASIKTRKVKGYEHNTYYRVTLSGAPLSSIPVLLERKKVNSTPNKNQYRQHVDIVKTSDYAEYYGFEVDKDNLYVEANNYSIIHNSGKSRGNIEDVIKHVLLIPSARVCVAARTYPALESTFIREFYSMFPSKLVKSKNDQKHEITLTNGSEIIFRSFDDPTKLKSMNLTMAVIIEASDVPYTGFTMLQSRLRNTAAMIPYVDDQGDPVREWDPRQKTYKIKYRVDARHINLETNPDAGWIKSKFLLDSGTVEFYGDAYNEGYKFNKDRDPNKYTQVVSTSANPYLPPGYEEEQSRGKSPAYIQQFFKGSFNFATNLVLPNFGLCIVPPHELPRAFDDNGRRVLFYLIGLDYGVNDPTHIIYAAFSKETKKLYVYDELRLNNSDVKTIAKQHRKQLKINNTDLRGLLMMPRFDGRSFSRRESDLRTIGEMFEAEGLYFEPSFALHDARIIKLNALVNHEQLEVFSTCEFLIEEALNYKWKLDKNGNPTGKPEDKNDHGVTALEFIVVDLPPNLKELNLSAYLPPGVVHVHDKQVEIPVKKQQPFNPLSTEDRNDRNNVSFINNITYAGRPTPVRAYSIYDSQTEDTEDTGDPDEFQQFRAYVPGRR